MSIAFKMVAKQNNIANPPQIKYYPCAVNQGAVNLNSLANEVARRSSLTKADCYAAIISLIEVMSEELAEGRIVNLGDLGSFKLTLQGLPADSPDPLGKDKIKKARIVFKPARPLKKMLAILRYKRLR